MTYRERRLRKAERLREWAGKREQKATAAYGKAHGIADMIPFGQPILVGHHSEGRARRDQGRIHAGMRASIEHGQKADDFRGRAAGIEAAADRAIYSDDPDAIEQLETRIVGLEAERDRIKAFNASCRKGARDVSLLDERQQAKLESVAKVAAYSLGKNGAYPAYALTNLGGNINRQRERLRQLQGQTGCRVWTPGKGCWLHGEICQEENVGTPA